LEVRTTGIPGLDEILGGGIPRPSTVLLAGNPGTGRTTLGIQSLCYAAARGEKVLYVCPTSKSEKSVREALSGYDFYDDSLNIRIYSISSVERDPLTMLVDLGNTVANMKPDRVMIDPVTPIGFGFAEAERRRFMYSLNTAMGEWNAIVYLTGTMATSDVCRSVISDIADGVIYLTQKINRVHNDRRLKVIKFNSIHYVDGEHSFEITGSGANIYPRMEYLVAENYTGSVRTGFGIPLLDGFLGGGLFKGSSTLLTGNTGTGKTLFGLQFIVHGAMNGEPGIISSFEETPQELRHYAANAGMDLKGLEEMGMISIMHTSPSEVNACKQAIQLKEAIEETGAKRILLDDISGFDYIFKDSIEKREHISNLIRLFKNKEVTSMFINSNQATGVDSLAPSIPISAIVDNLLLLRHTEDMEEIKKSFYILKSHGTDHEKRLIRYEVTGEGIKISDFQKDT
jgi:circadian clock protein KaiC